VNLLNISEVKILKIVADKCVNGIQTQVNEVLLDGWQLLQIDTQASNINGNGSQNFYVYHFGKHKIVPKEKKEI